MAQQIRPYNDYILAHWNNQNSFSKPSILLAYNDNNDWFVVVSDNQSVLTVASLVKSSQIYAISKNAHTVVEVYDGIPIYKIVKVSATKIISCSSAGNSPIEKFCVSIVKTMST